MDSINKILLNRTAKQAPKATFKSFLSPNGRTGHSEKSSCSSDTTIEDGCTRSEDDLDSEILLMPGEIIIQRTEEVSRTNLYSCENLDSVGALLVTNYRVVFIPNARSPTNGKFDSARKNKLIGMEDVSLSNIFAVYQVAKGKRRRLSPNTLMLGIVKRLQLHCKDFRVHQFCFKDSLRDHVKVSINAILHHYCPMNVELLFTFAYNSNNNSVTDDGPVPDGQPPIPGFLSAEDWQKELKRLRANSFEVTNCNREFVMSDSLPESFVLPTSMTESQIQKSGLNANNKCFPVWSYSHVNGCALIRMADGLSDTEDNMFESVRRSHPKLVPPEVINIESTGLPSLRKLQANFEQLREICMPCINPMAPQNQAVIGSISRRSVHKTERQPMVDKQFERASYKELVNADNSWLSLLDSCQWMYAVSTALSVAIEVVEKIAWRSRTVIIKEKDGTDFNALISGLVQLMLDVESRTIFGFQSLVEKEWVALGHRFAQRCDIVCSKDAEQSPVFLLFLDCVWQLLQQFPSSFEFTELFLISIWDSVGLGMFRNFVYNGPHDRSIVQKSLLLDQALRSNQTTNRAPFPKSVWNWKLQFLPEDIAFFTNPLFSAEEQIRGLRTRRDKTTVKTLPLVPCCNIAALKFWDNCYLRWLGPLEIIGGGKPAEYITQTLIMEDIASLQMAITELEEASAAKPTNEQRRNRVSPFVYGDNSSLLRRKLSKHVSSSYPFSPTQLATHHTLLLPIPSSDNRSSANEDTFSIDELSLADGVDTAGSV